MERATCFLFGRGARGLYRSAAARCCALPDVARAVLPSRCEWMIYARKRPLVAAEEAAGDVDACNASIAYGDVVCHAGKMRRSGRALDVQHTRFKLDAVFDEATTNIELCRAVVAPLLAWLSATRRRATLLFFGQTGTGKTHSLMGALDYFMTYVDTTLGGRAGAAVHATAYEVKGSQCFDLLAERKRVKLLCGADGRMHVRGARSVSVDAGECRAAGALAAELRHLLNGALALRATLATERNSHSSRSHLIVTLSIGYGDDRGESVFTLVDLAGSERKHETTAMSAADHRESAAINTALMALKDCCRASHR